MGTLLDKREKLRADLQKIKKLKTFDDLHKDLSNFHDIMDEYEQIAKTARELQPLEGHTMKEVHATHSMDFQFYRLCSTRIRRITEEIESSLKHLRGLEYNVIRKDHPRADLSERGVNQLIDGNEKIRVRNAKLLRAREVMDLYDGILDSYTIRGYQINNLTRFLSETGIDIENYVI